MPRIDNRKDVDRLKQLLTTAWRQILKKVPDEQVYAFGLFTDESGQSMFPFLLGEMALRQIARKYVDEGHCTTDDEAAEGLRWATGDSPYASRDIYHFDGRPVPHDLPPTSTAREIHYRLTAACTALHELDKERLFGTGAGRERITLYIEGGDVDRAWLLKWAKKLNPRSIYERYAAVGAPTETAGTFTEFGTKKVYETRQYAQSADRKLIAAATQYQLIVFDTSKKLKQLFAKALPTRQDYTSLGGVAMSGDGKLVAVIPFAADGPNGNAVFVLTGGKGENVTTARLKKRPMAVAVSPAGDWIAATDDSGALNLLDRSGKLTATRPGHAHWPRGIAVSRDGKHLATGDTRSAILWNTTDWSQVWQFERPIDRLDFDPTGRFVVGCCHYALADEGPKAAAIVDVKTAKVIREVIVDGYRIKHARFSPDGRLLACAMREDCDGYSGTDVSALVDIESGEVLQTLKSDFEQVRDFAFLPHRGEIAVAVFGHSRRPLVLWKVWH